ncbi:MAG: iron ABC transporter substrate-binding protein, partial [Chloroflexi bacterium]|nr:iron ABC transporter substrate-binding protein [Chloroflexota bacterium]
MLIAAACSGARTVEVTKEVPVEVVRQVPADPGSLVVYSGRTESLVAPIIKQFSEATGVKVRVKYGDTAAIAATLLEEGARSPADVFFAQDPGGLGAVQGMLAPLPDQVLNRVPDWAHSPQRKWVGISGRARVVVYNTESFNEKDLPDSVRDFTNPAWKGKIGWAPTNGSFLAMVTAMRKVWGEEQAEQWVRGIQANEPKVYGNNTAIVQAVGAGEVQVGFVNHYYLLRILAEKGESFPARNYYTRAADPGSVVLIAGAGVLETARNKENAEKFVEFLLGTVAQQYFASQT